jgi:epoxyqueuosine reductase
MDDSARGRIVELARAEGFALVRFAPAAVLGEARQAALRARTEGRLAEMGWMTDAWLERATDPGRFLEGAKTVVMVALPCHGPEPQHSALSTQHSRGRVARYAWGRDYHRVFEKKLRRMARALREEFEAEARPTVDYGPLLERPLAALSGMGWQGKSTMLLAPGLGPWVLLGAIATTLEIEPDEPLKKSCGSCTRCIAACPTGAISAEGGLLDARLCISYHTIENRGPIPRDLRAKFGGWIFGCDDCLESCPVGASRFESHPDLSPAAEEDARPELTPLLELDAEAFSARFRGRAMMRAKRDGLLRNVCVALGNVGGEDDLPALCRALDDGSALVRGHAAWAVGRLVARVRLGTRNSALGTRQLSRRLAIEQDDWVREEIELALGALTQSSVLEPQS